MLSFPLFSSPSLPCCLVVPLLQWSEVLRHLPKYLPGYTLGCSANAHLGHSTVWTYDDHTKPCFQETLVPTHLLAAMLTVGCYVAPKHPTGMQQETACSARNHPVKLPDTENSTIRIVLVTVAVPGIKLATLCLQSMQSRLLSYSARL